jgi:glycosyltransferase involved in cell wall biosynthesis
MKRLSILSLGSTRGLWEGPASDDYLRLMAYAEGLEGYTLISSSYRHHGLTPRRITSTVKAIPTNAFHPLDGLIRMLGLGFRLLRRRPVDVIQAQDPFYYGLAAWVLGTWFRLPVNVCIYGPNPYDPYWLSSHWSHRFLGWVGRFVLTRVQGIQVDGELTRRRLVEAGYPPAKIHRKPVVPNNLDAFFSIPEERPRSERIRLLFVGRFVRQKNLPMLLEVVRQLSGRLGKRFEWVLVGEGPELHRLQSLIEAASLDPWVRLLGTQSRERMPSIFAEADVFVLASSYEGFARVLMEAAAAALPIVTTAVSGAEDAVASHETGWVVPVDAVDAFAEAVERLIVDSSERLRMGRAARAKVRRELDPSENAVRQTRIWRVVSGGDSEPKPAEAAVPAGHEGPL